MNTLNKKLIAEAQLMEKEIDNIGFYINDDFDKIESALKMVYDV